MDVAQKGGAGVDIRTLSLDPNARPLSVTLAGRLTCVCPVNERRDHATIQVVYRPVGAAVELESFARYLSHWSETQASHELVTQEIADDIKQATEAEDVTVRTTWEPVEGIACVVVAHR